MTLATETIRILLVEDNPGDARITQEALHEGKWINDLHANCYIIKPVNLDQFLAVARSIENFWLTVVKLPRLELVA